MPPAVHAFKGPPMGERTLKKRFVKHKALNKGKPYYSDSPRSHLYWCLLPWDGVLLTRADPAQLLLRLALCWLTRCKFSATHIDVLNMRQQAFFFLSSFKPVCSLFFLPHPLPPWVSVHELSSHRFSCLDCPRNGFLMPQETTRVLANKYFCLMTTPPELKQGLY